MSFLEMSCIYTKRKDIHKVLVIYRLFTNFLPTRQQDVVGTSLLHLSIRLSDVAGTSEMKDVTVSRWNVAKSSQCYVFTTSCWNVVTTS